MEIVPKHDNSVTRKQAASHCSYKYHKIFVHVKCIKMNNCISCNTALFFYISNKKTCKFK